MVESNRKRKRESREREFLIDGSMMFIFSLRVEDMSYNSSQGFFFMSILSTRPREEERGSHFL